VRRKKEEEELEEAKQVHWGNVAPNGGGEAREMTWVPKRNHYKGVDGKTHHKSRVQKKEDRIFFKSK